MAGYEPIEPVDAVAARLGIPEEQIVKLDGNENPYGPSPAVAEALARFPYYHIYPDPEQRRLRSAIAGYVGVDEEQIVAGSGSDEPLDLVARLFLSPGDVMLNAPPSFGMYPFLARLYGARLLEVPRLEDFRLDLPALEAALGEGAKLLYLASPNNPTGNVLSREELERLLERRAVVVVDEAYAEFDGESFVQMVGERDNLIVVRTFSKWAGLAGLRIGYGVFPRALAEAIRKIKMPYSVNVAAEVAALASLDDVATLRQRVGAIVAERERLGQGLAELGWLQPFPSRANFLLCEVRGIAAVEVRDRLREKGVLVRYFNTPMLRSCLRFSVGKPEDTDRLLEALAEIGERVGR
ncbi:MAG: histidinol-phosphate transaminase [Dehalococcoidia bacterium]